MFENLRNFIVCGALIYAGIYAVHTSEEALPYPKLGELTSALIYFWGTVLILFGLLITLLNFSFALRKFLEMSPPFGIRILFALAYAALFIVLAVAIDPLMR